MSAAAVLALLVASGAGPDQLPAELVRDLERNAEAVRCVSLHWLRSREPGCAEELAPSVIHGPDFYAELECRLHAESFRYHAEESSELAQYGPGGFEGMVPCTSEVAYDGERLFQLQEIDGQRRLRILVPTRARWADETTSMTTRYLLEAGLVAPWTFSSHRPIEPRSRLLAELDTPGVSWTTSEQAGSRGSRERVVELDSGGERRRYVLDPERAHALLRFERWGPEGLIEQVVLSDLRELSWAKGLWFPWRIERRHHQWHGVPAAPTERPLFVDRSQLQSLSHESVDPAKFVIALNEPGLAVADQSLPGAELEGGEMAQYVFPAGVAELDRTLSELEGRVSLIPAPRPVWPAVLMGAVLGILAFGIGRVRGAAKPASMILFGVLGLGLAGPARAAGLEEAPVAELDAEQLRARLLELDQGVRALRVVYRSSSYEAGRAPDGAFFHKIVHARAPGQFRLESGHGHRSLRWSDDPYRQTSVVNAGEVQTFTHLDRSFFRRACEQPGPLPGTLQNEFFFLTTGLWPLSGREPPRREGEPLVFAEVGRCEAYDRVRPRQELVEGRWCHVLEREGRDVLWLDVERGPALLQRDCLDEGERSVRFRLGGHRRVEAGVWLPSWIEREQWEASEGADPVKLRAVRMEVLETSLGPLDDALFEPLLPAGALESDPDDPRAAPTQVVAGGREELLRELLGWCARVHPTRRVAAPPRAIPWHLIVGALLALLAVEVGRWAQKRRSAPKDAAREGPLAEPGSERALVAD